MVRLSILKQVISGILAAKFFLNRSMRDSSDTEFFCLSLGHIIDYLKILQGILHTENESKQNHVLLCAPNHRRRKDKESESNIN
jgi:hypothetical protein